MNMTRGKPWSRKAFTLIELLVVIAIIAILAPSTRILPIITTPFPITDMVTI